MRMALVLALALPLLAQEPTFEKRAIEIAKRLPVSELEQGMPKQPLPEWLRRAAGPGAKLEWELNDCGEQTGTAADAGRDFPFCVETIANLADGRRVGVSVVMGTFQRGIVGKPQLFMITLGKDGKFEFVSKLRELPAKIQPLP
jgi:hypothetical protein